MILHLMFSITPNTYTISANFMTIFHNCRWAAHLVQLPMESIRMGLYATIHRELKKIILEHIYFDRFLHAHRTKHRRWSARHKCTVRIICASITTDVVFWLLRCACKTYFVRLNATISFPGYISIFQWWFHYLHHQSNLNLLSYELSI